MHHVMMVVPVNSDVNETQEIAEEHRQQRHQVLQTVTMRHLHLQHHDGDDDCDHAIAECFQSPLGHLPSASTNSSRAPELSQAIDIDFYLLYVALLWLHFILCGTVILGGLHV